MFSVTFWQEKRLLRIYVVLCFALAVLFKITHPCLPANTRRKNVNKVHSSIERNNYHAKFFPRLTFGQLHKTTLKQKTGIDYRMIYKKNSTCHVECFFIAKLIQISKLYFVIIYCWGINRPRTEFSCLESRFLEFKCQQIRGVTLPMSHFRAER